MTLASALLQRTIDERNSYRLLSLAALDQLYEFQRTIERQREQIVALREELICRMGAK